MSDREHAGDRRGFGTITLGRGRGAFPCRHGDCAFTALRPADYDSSSLDSLLRWAADRDRHEVQEHGFVWTSKEPHDGRGRRRRYSPTLHRPRLRPAR